MHAMHKVFEDMAMDAVILVDAANTFNNLNRQVALNNIQFICPSIVIILINCYRSDINLFVRGEVILLQEGRPQGDPLAMAFFALASVPLIKATATENVTQTWFADDAASGGKLKRLRSWWDRIVNLEPTYGYFPNAEKTYLVVKPEKRDEASTIFFGTNITIRQTGKRYLEGMVGSDAFAQDFVRAKVEKWAAELD